MSKKIKIGINASFTPSGGSLTQITNMIHYLSDMKNLELVIYSKKNNNYIFENINLRNHKISLSWLSNTHVLGRVIWEQLLLPLYLKNDRIDLLFCPGNIAPYFSPVKTVQWIGTIGPFHKDFYRHFSITEKIKLYINKIIMYKSAQKSDAVIFESNYTMRLFIDEYKVRAERSYVINIGKSKFFYPINQQQGITLSDKYDSFKSYALCVSHLYPYKNIPRMIEAFAIAKRITESDHKLLIAGNKKSNKYYNQIIDTINKLNLQNTVILLGAVSKEDLRYLYSSCKFFVFPSPYENFAITLVEAMCCGAAIICANTTAMPETCQEAAMYFDPNNTEEMAEKIEFFMSNEELRNSLKQKSLNRVKELPDYKTVTIKTLDIMNNIVQK